MSRCYACRFCFDNDYCDCSNYFCECAKKEEQEDSALDKWKRSIWREYD